MENGVSVTFDSLVQELSNPLHHVPAARLIALSGLGADEASSLRDVWRGIEVTPRQRLVHDLVELAEDNLELDFAAVFIIALKDSAAEVRRDAIHGLWEHEGRDLLHALLELLEKDPDAGVRADAGLALGRFVLQAEFGVLSARDAERVEGGLQRTFNDPTEPVEVRARAIEALGALSEEWVRDLIDEAFTSGDRRLEISAVHAMGRSADTAWLSSVLAQLESDDDEMRFEAATAVGAIGDSEATPHLLALLSDDDIEVRMAAINALGLVGGDDAKEALRELRADGDERFAEATADALAEIDFAEDPLALNLQE